MAAGHGNIPRPVRTDFAAEYSKNVCSFPGLAMGANRRRSVAGSDIFRTRGERFSYSRSSVVLSRQFSPRTTQSSWIRSWMEKRRILIVDNNDELRVLLERALEELGHNVVAAAERDTALSRDDLDSFDLIIKIGRAHV